MKNKFWMENLKAIIAGSVVGLLVLGLIYWKFFMPQPPPPGYGPPPGGAPAGGEQGSTTQTRSHKHSKKNRLSAGSLTIKINTTPHIQIQTIHRNTDIRRRRQSLTFEFSRLRSAPSSPCGKCS